jgi:hypothetical protein
MLLATFSVIPPSDHVVGYCLRHVVTECTATGANGKPNHYAKAD